MADASLTWLGHSAFRLDTPGGKRIYVDPFLSGNPTCPEAEQNPQRVDIVALTHGHSDHVGDTVQLAKKFGAEIVAQVELKGWLGKPDVAVLPIGDWFTMGPDEAAVALELLGVKRCVPCHYGTFPLLTGRPSELQERAPDVQVHELEPGGTLEL
jgi:L-ascorbate metabolism protein UlaG (beta-lactamase superfamily)